MKKFGMFALAALLVVMFTIPAGALENKFGGYWRTRFYTNQDFSGDDSESMDYTVVDTRSRIYYTAILNDDLKFVNKFEMDATWGDTSHGDIGADGKNVEIKNTYADFNLTPNLNTKVGVQGATLARGFLFDDDFSGAVVAMKGEGLTIPFIWIKAYEGNNTGKGLNKRDVDYYAIAPSFQAGEAFTISPFILYATSDNAQDWSPTAPYDDVSLYYVGVDGALSSETFNVNFTGIYLGGDADLVAGGSHDFSAFLAAAGLGLNFGAVDVHGQAFYATGDDTADMDQETFMVPAGQSYYWAEIMGLGTFDAQVSNNSPADQIGNIMAANIGVGFKPMDGMSMAFDVWYASLVEETSDSAGETDLGIELDATLSYQLVEGLSLDVVAAYLLAGDATTEKASNDADPFEIGSQLSLKF
jgi:hypothetical protein